MNSKPMTYDSLKSVLQYLDPNLRFLISTRIPSVQVAERSAPLKIERLHFSDRRINVNQTSYSLNVCFEGPDNLFTHSSNSDVNEYGETDEISLRTVLPGDVVLKPLDPHPIPPAMTEERMNEEIGKYEKEIKLNRMKLVLLDSLSRESLAEVPENFKDGPLSIFIHRTEAQVRAMENSPVVQQLRTNAATVIKYTIEENEQSLQALLNRRDNIRPNFKIELEITSPSGVRTERVKYTAKLHSAEKSLLKMMFGNRKHVVQVRKLVISHCMAIRFPPGLKMKIRELELIGNIRHFHSALNAIVDSSSYPLESLEIGYDSEDGQEMEHEVVQSAKSLILYFGSFDTPLLPIFLNLQNKKVHVGQLELEHETVTIEEHVQLIKSWLEVGKPSGTCFTFAMQDEEKGTAILEMAKQQCDGAVAEDQCVVIPMNVSSRLKLSNELVPEEGHDNRMFKMEVCHVDPL